MPGLPTTGKLGADVAVLLIARYRTQPRTFSCASDAQLRISPKSIRLIVRLLDSARINVLKLDDYRIMLLPAGTLGGARGSRAQSTSNNRNGGERRLRSKQSD